MLHCFGFESVAVVVGDLYFFDDAAPADQQGAECGVRLELRKIEREPLVGSVYSAQPIRIGEPIWRADLLRSITSEPGSFDRTHHHPRFRGWEPGHRVFDEELSAGPLDWLGERLRDIKSVVEGAGLDPAELAPGEAEQVREQAEEIVDVARRLLERIEAGELAVPPDEQPAVTTRVGWL